MIFSKQLVQGGVLAALLMGLSACGGSGSSADSSEASTTFTVSLAAVDVRRVSNDADVSVDTTGIISGELTLQP